MDDLEIAILGGSRQNSEGAPLWNPAVPLTDNVNDVNSLPNVPVFQGLGISSMPAAPDGKGHAEALIARNCGGFEAVAIGARDTRSAGIVGQLRPGDTAVHTTGPNQGAQLLLKDNKRMAVLTARQANRKSQAVVLNGDAEKLQILANGAVIEITEDGAITLTCAGGGAGIKIADGQVNIMGRVVLGGLTAVPGQAIMLGPVTGFPPGPTPVLQPAVGVFIGM